MRLPAGAMRQAGKNKPLFFSWLKLNTVRPDAEPDGEELCKINQIKT
jgi:hypothetical protein